MLTIAFGGCDPAGTAGAHAVEMESLFDQLGGRPGLSATVDEFCLRALADPALSRYVHDLDPAVVKPQLYAFLAATLGEPAAQRPGGDPPLARLRQTGVLPAEIPSIHVDNALGQLADALRARGVSEDLIGLVITELLPVKDELLGAGLRPAYGR